jgi:addiction module HigA family antidote
MNDISARRPNRAPIHPGVILRESIMPSTGLSVTATAEALRITRQQLHRVLSEDSGISPEMALRLGKFCGNGPELWLRMQEAYDLWHARRKIGAELDKIEVVEAIHELPNLDVKQAEIGATHAHSR